MPAFCGILSGFFRRSNIGHICSGKGFQILQKPDILNKGGVDFFSSPSRVRALRFYLRHIRYWCVPACVSVVASQACRTRCWSLDLCSPQNLSCNSPAAGQEMLRHSRWCSIIHLNISVGYFTDLTLQLTLLPQSQVLRRIGHGGEGCLGIMSACHKHR